MSHLGETLGNVVGSVVGGITGAKQAGQAGEHAADVQAGAAQAGIDEQKRQFDAIVQMMHPYVSGGEKSLGMQQAMLGLNGPVAQSWALGSIATSPEMQSLTKQGEDAILQNASATGGLRGGNIQGALANFRANTLNSLIQQRFQNLGGLAGMGQASAGNQAAMGQQNASNIANLLAQQGAAQAGGIMSKGGVAGQSFGNLLDIGAMIMGGKKAGMF